MHLGNARTALLAWLSARHQGGAVVLRSEDLDRARVPAGAEARLLEDLAWLGLDWDEGPDRGGPHGPYRQSERAARYDAAVDRLLAQGDAFLCACSRADVARAASAPHEAAEEFGSALRYPGTCRTLAPDEVLARAQAQGRRPTVRYRGAGRALSFVDLVHGAVDPLGPEGLDDFVLRRADGTAAYQLAVVVDDAAMDIDEVVRGDDLLRSTPRQLALYQALGLRVPRFAHVPLLLAPSGERLAKRTRPQGVADLRAEGVSAETIIGALATSLALCAPGQRLSARALVPDFAFDRITRAPGALDPTSLLRDTP